LTSIGSDLSTLSNALDSLTDFQGVLSEKEGSSSDNSVVEITGASTSAVAGTHTIVVNKLAQTSSYSSDAVASGDELTGNLTVTIGGKSQTIDLGSSGQTLAQIESTINSGSYGVTANVLTTSTGSVLSLVSSTSGAAGEVTLGGTVTDSTSGNTVNFTENQTGQDASLTVDGVPGITSSSNTVTNAINGVTLQLLSASATGAAPVQVEITNDNTDVESAINTFVSAYNTVLGDLNTQEGNDSSGNPEPLFGNPTLATIQEQLQSALTFIQPSNAAGTTSTINSGDTFSGSLSIQVGSGAAQTVNVPTGGTLADLAAAINSTANIGVTATVVTSGGEQTLSLTSSVAGSAGAITVDSSQLTDTTTGSNVAFGSSQASGITSLTQLGVSVSNNGTLSLDTDTLDSELNSNYQDVVNFFQPSGAFTSFGGNMTTALSNLGSSATNGAISLALQQNSSQESQLNTNLSNENNVISAEQTRLTTELNEANFTLEQIPEELQSVNELYSAITGFNENPQN
jgi:flagellar hook-associated protein 2